MASGWRAGLRIGVFGFLAAAGAATDTTAPAREGFSLGIFGPFTIWNHGIIAGGVAFDLDLRKHFEPELQARFGPPVIEIPHVHPGLKNVTIQLGTSHGSSSIGLKTAIDWLQGSGGSNRVVGIVGGIFSSITMPVASMAAVFEVPQVAYGATNNALSDKTAYPYFSRVMAADSFITKAIWAWKVHFQVPSLAVFHQQDSYGTGFYEAMRVVAQEAGGLDMIFAIGFANMDVENFDAEVAKDAWSRLRASGTKFCLMVTLIGAQMLHTLEQEGMLYSGTFQFLSPQPSELGKQGGLSPSQGYPVGYQVCFALSRGPRLNALEEHWNRMTPDDLYGEQARQRYNLDAMKVPLSADSRLAATNATFTRSYFLAGRWHLSARLFDAAYSLAIGINNCLLKGLAPEEIQGKSLLDEVRAVDFAGTRCTISFDENGDVRAEFGIFNSVTGGDNMDLMASINPSTGVVKFYDPEAGGLMWTSGNMSLTAPASLLTCDPGQQWNTLLGRCSGCLDGFISPGGAMPECRACPVGTTSNAEATECMACGRGSFNELPGHTCSRCAPGKFSAEPGASVCMDCEVGTYAEQPAATACDLCGAGRHSQALYTTMQSLEVAGKVEYLFVAGAASSDLCSCDRGTRNSSSGECVPCTEGLLCEGMGNVVVEAGYYSAKDFSVFRCHGDKDRCPGGEPGDCCAKGREALGCAECKDGMTPDSNGGCTECGNSDKAPFAFAVFVMVSALTMAYYLIDNHNRATQSHALLICAFAISQFVTTIQLIGVVGMLTFEWRDPLKSFLDSLSLFIFNFEMLRLGCVGQVQPLLIYLVKVLAIFAVLLVVVLLHCIFVAVRHKGQFSARSPVLVAAIGTVFMVSYISVTSAVLEPLRCLPHPNGMWTVQEYPSIICWETGEHATMLVLGNIMFLTVPIGFIAATCYVVRDFPKRLREADSRAVKAFSFLFFRFRPGCHNYVVAFVLRSFMVALVLVVPDLLVQAFLLISILLVGFAVILLWLPWRVAIANVLEAVLTCTTLLLVALGVAFIPEEDKEPENIADVALVATLLSLALFPCAAAYGVWRRFFRFLKPFEFFLCHYKVGSGAWTRLLKFHLLDSRKVKTDVFVDSDNLDHLDHLFDYVGNDTGTLVVVGTPGIFQRPWCLGEMCTARLKGVKTILLSLPNFQLPEGSFIVELQSKVNNLEILVESGMTVALLQNTLHWMCSVPQIMVPPVVTVPLMDSIAGALFGKTTEAITTIEVPASKQEGSKAEHSGMLCDLSDLEALATCSILRRMLTTLLADQPKTIPTVVDADSPCDSIAMALVVCTNLAFTRISFLELLGRCASCPRLLPVIAEAGFKVPGKSFAERLQTSLLPAGLEHHQQLIAGTVSALFKKIGTNFEAGNASEKVLEASAAVIAKQIKGWGMMPTSSTGLKSKSPGCMSPSDSTECAGDRQTWQYRSRTSAASASSPTIQSTSPQSSQDVVQLEQVSDEPEEANKPKTKYLMVMDL